MSKFQRSPYCVDGSTGFLVLRRDAIVAVAPSSNMWSSCSLASETFPLLISWMCLMTFSGLMKPIERSRVPLEMVVNLGRAEFNLSSIR